MESNRDEKEENKEKEKKIEKEKKDAKKQFSFEIQLGKYLNKDNCTLKDLIEYIKKTLKTSEEISKTEKMILKLILDINPTIDTFKTEENGILMQNLMMHLLAIKKKYSQISPSQLYNALVLICNNIPFLKNLFEKNILLEGKEDKYLELLLPFIPAKQTQLIINNLNKDIDEKDLKYIENVLNNLYLKVDKSFIFLKNLLISIIIVIRQKRI